MNNDPFVINVYEGQLKNMAVENTGKDELIEDKYLFNFTKTNIWEEEFAPAIDPYKDKIIQADMVETNLDAVSSANYFNSTIDNSDYIAFDEDVSFSQTRGFPLEEPLKPFVIEPSDEFLQQNPDDIYQVDDVKDNGTLLSDEENTEDINLENEEIAEEQEPEIIVWKGFGFEQDEMEDYMPTKLIQVPEEEIYPINLTDNSDFDYDLLQEQVEDIPEEGDMVIESLSTEEFIDQPYQEEDEVIVEDLEELIEDEELELEDPTTVQFRREPLFAYSSKISVDLNDDKYEPEDIIEELHEVDEEISKDNMLEIEPEPIELNTESDILIQEDDMDEEDQEASGNQLHSTDTYYDALYSPKQRESLFTPKKETVDYKKINSTIVTEQETKEEVLYDLEGKDEFLQEKILGQLEQVNLQLTQLIDTLDNIFKK